MKSAITAPVGTGTIRCVGLRSLSLRGVPEVAGAACVPAVRISLEADVLLSLSVGSETTKPEAAEYKKAPRGSPVATLTAVPE